MLRSRFDIDSDDEFVYIEDTGEGMSVTNDAENVVHYLHDEGFLDAGHHILYRDTDGSWDELEHDEGEFSGFGPIGARTRDGAARVWRERHR